MDIGMNKQDGGQFASPPLKKTKTKKASAKAAKKGTRGDRAKRLLDLVVFLMRARTPVTYREIRENFVSYKTANPEAGLRAFERDKADLLELGVPVKYITPDDDDAVDEGGYVVKLNRYRLPEVHLTTDEVSSLVLAASVAKAVPGASYARFCDLALKKLSFDFPDPDTPLQWPPPASALTKSEPVLVHFPETGHAREELSERFNLLESATRNRKQITIKYQAGGTGYVRTRDVLPYGLLYREKSWLLVGFCKLRKDLRSFRIDRISDLKVAPKPKSPDFERPKEFDLRKYANRSPWTFEPDAKEKVTLHFLPAAKNISNEDFGEDATRTADEDGSTTVTFECGNHNFLVNRVLASKGSIQIKSGPMVLQKLKAELGALEGFYR